MSNSITFTYNTAGQVLTATDQAQDKTTFVYSSAGDLTSVQDPNGNTTKAGYDGAGAADRRYRPAAQQHQL